MFFIQYNYIIEQKRNLYFYFIKQEIIYIEYQNLGRILIGWLCSSYDKHFAKTIVYQFE